MQYKEQATSEASGAHSNNQERNGKTLTGRTSTNECVEFLATKMKPLPRSECPPCCLCGQMRCCRGIIQKQLFSPTNSNACHSFKGWHASQHPTAAHRSYNASGRPERRRAVLHASGAVMPCVLACPPPPPPPHTHTHTHSHSLTLQLKGTYLRDARHRGAPNYLCCRYIRTYVGEPDPPYSVRFFEIRI